MRLIPSSILTVGLVLAACGGSGNTAVIPGGSGGAAGVSSGSGGNAGRGGSGSSSGGQSGAAGSAGAAGAATGGMAGAGSGNGGDGGTENAGAGGAPVLCGNGSPDPDEECDTGSVSATCDADCTLAVCGDGTVNVEAGEECDTSGATAECDADCTYVICGDGAVHDAAGEECDTRGETASCDVDCTPPACGDGVTNIPAGEECDDGDASPGGGCGELCEFEGAGSGGDTCATAMPLTLGTNQVNWTASTKDYLNWRPTCSQLEPRAVDVVLSYTATFTGSLEVNLAKPDSLSWVAVVNDGACGDTSAPVACISRLPLNSMTDRLAVVSGKTYYFYVARTGTDVTPLANPFTVSLTQLPAVTGESCNDPVWLTHGDNTISWTASQNDHFFQSPSCADGAAIDGPDVALFYNAAYDGYTRFEIEKPVATRWVAAVTAEEEGCGDVPSALACVSSYTGTSLSGMINVGASFTGQTGDNWRSILVADTSGGANPLASPLKVRITPMDEQGGTGETCNTTARRITLGTNTVTWLGSVNDHLTASPSCADGHAVTGPDAVFEYNAPTSGNVTVTINKPAGARWVAVASDYQCGNVASPLTCMSDFANTTMSGSFAVTAGFKYFLYVAATDEGTIPLYSPLTITLSQ